MVRAVFLPLSFRRPSQDKSVIPSARMLRRISPCLFLLGVALAPGQVIADGMKHWLKQPVLYGGIEVDGEYEVGRDDEGLGKQLQEAVGGSGRTSFKARGTFRLERSGEGVFPGDIEYTGKIDGPACVTSSHSQTITRRFTTEISCTGEIADGKVKLTVNPEQRRYWLEIEGHMTSCRGREEGPHPTELGSVKERSLDGKRERFHVRVHDWLPLPERSPPINGSSPVSVNLNHALTSQASRRPKGTWWIGPGPAPVVTKAALKCTDKKEVKVALDGCTDLALGGNGAVVATTEPSGGALRFWAEPAVMLSVEPQGGKAELTGRNPGRTTINVEYTVGGKSASDSKSGSVVDLVSINGGNPLPRLGLYDISSGTEGGLYEFPIEVKPAGGGTLLSFDSPIVSVIPRKDSIVIRPAHAGRAILQAKTACGQPVGPAVVVEVSECDERTTDARLNDLMARQQLLNQRMKQVASSVQSALNHPDFVTASNRIDATIWTMAKKASEVIVSTASIKNALAGQEARGVEELNTVIDVVNTGTDLVVGKTDDAAAGTALIAGQTLGGKGKVGWTAQGISYLKTWREAAEAADRLGGDLGSLYGTAEGVERARQSEDEIMDEFRKVSNEIDRVRSVCGTTK